MATFTVSYTVDVEADSVLGAARQVAELLSEPEVPGRATYHVSQRLGIYEYDIDLDDPANGGKGVFQ